MPYQVVIVDDEMPARMNILNLISQHDDFVVVGEASSGTEAVKLCEKAMPDIVFLDIQLQDMTGLDVAAMLIKLPSHPKIVFVTAFNEYAIKAFEFSVVDYLLKPIDEKRFIMTINKLRREVKYSSQTTIDAVHILIKKHLQLEHSKQKISLEKDGKLFVLSPRDIIYIETSNRNTKVISSRGDFISSLSISDWDERLQEHGFFRPHRSFLINLDEIDEIILWFHNSLQIKMRGHKNNIPISRNKLKEFKEKVGLEN
ncbi:LytR/AlgR family response regulator transcription factor [Serpentinicella alkaliphila]|uniref:Stage 0 sporulation protein A homolog n=1 Tax=Serpentinicella alkaliphila TaxID=1734049 RepID=A0A4R2T1N5_9FIRM|nr:LytTR family DNA-binding domain-containing protein [Serpentinicella alkaliphila]QUH27139.1 response regulator transcription factor [Serpentinicella alkaliphila]TCP95046.1 LytTR family two component transcriptional regulator [Serpentinicella alkaliphila]